MGVGGGGGGDGVGVRKEVERERGERERERRYHTSISHDQVFSQNFAPILPVPLLLSCRQPSRVVQIAVH